MIKLLSKTDSIYEFMIYDLETEYINGFRRVLYSNLKGNCIDKNSTVFIKNNTNINNEIITHRLSLIPIKSDKKLNFTLKKKNNTDNILNIYSHDLVCNDKNFEIKKNILLHKLKKDEEINLITSTNLSSGSNNASYRPFSICYFKIMKFIYVKKNLDDSMLKKIKNRLNLYNIDLHLFDNIDGYKLIGFTDEIRDYNDPLKNILDNNDYMIKEIEYNNKYVYYFTIEMFYENNNIMKCAIDLLINDLYNFKKLEKNIIENNINLKLKINNGKYHILNILSKYLRNYKNLYSVYNKEHPLKDEIILEYRLNESNNYEEYILNIIDEIVLKLNNLIIS